MDKEQRRKLMPTVTGFIDQMKQFEPVGIEAEENGQSVKWGESWGECVEFPLTSKDMK
jgi:hypothetical protein